MVRLVLERAISTVANSSCSLAPFRSLRSRAAGLGMRRPSSRSALVTSILSSCTVDLLQHFDATSGTLEPGVCGIAASWSIAYEASKVTAKPLWVELAHLLEPNESYPVCKNWDGILVDNASWTVFTSKTERAVKRSAEDLPASAPAPAPIAMRSDGPRPETAKEVKTTTAASYITYNPGPDPIRPYSPKKYNKTPNSTAEKREELIVDRVNGTSVKKVTTAYQDSLSQHPCDAAPPSRSCTARHAARDPPFLRRCHVSRERAQHSAENASHYAPNP